MIGILLALQVNNWNEAYQDRKEERQILRQLRSEFQTNLDQLHDKFALRERLLNSGIEILSLINNPTANINPDTLDFLLSRTLPAPTFDASLGVTSDIINSGKLYLIQNDTLRQLISGWNGDISFAIEEEIIWREHRDRTYIPFLTEKYSLRNIQNDLLNDPAMVNIMTFNKNVRVATLIGKSMEKPEAADFLNNSDLEDHISNMLTFNYMAKIQMMGLQEKVETIIKMIDSEL
ncbi:hypothetical protein [Robiginitalea sp. SC105]|uniref:hypothetical protein n=1 Tax=Robiginitalea sp. SC105 TaxID=2762332 RepID=UPI00163ABA05|nr:hypothetical protein [Robiginitalea sp. SC105]